MLRRALRQVRMDARRRDEVKVGTLARAVVALERGPFGGSDSEGVHKNETRRAASRSGVASISQG